MKRRGFIALVGSALAWPVAVQGQQAARISRIGFLRVGTVPPSFIEPFRKGLNDLGYIEGQSVTIEYGLAESVAQLPDAAAKLVSSKVDVLVASGTPSVLPAKKATSEIPVVFVAALDPVATGAVATLARPGGNVTGVTTIQADLTGKRLELLKELLPQLATVAFLVRATSPATTQYVKEAEAAARALGVQLQVLAVSDPQELESAFNTAQGANALLQVGDAMLTAHRSLIGELALKYRLPSMSELRETVDAGGLMSYGPHYGDLCRRAARQVHEILKGAKPADLPVEQPTKFELVINLKTAKALGLTVPPALWARAEEVIE
jgi:putative ABC transport system substrate-binding protein